MKIIDFSEEQGAIPPKTGMFCGLSVFIVAASLFLQVNGAVAASTNGLPWLNLLLGEVDETPVIVYPVYASDYEAQVANYKAQYGKNDAWASWMLANKARYSATFTAAKSKPSTITISFRYETLPIAYNPAWTSEAEHMNALAKLASDAYRGYVFSFVFNGNTSTSYANIIAGLSVNNSYSWGKDVYLYFETIFNHEFGHTMKLLHHYDVVGVAGQHFPPGETGCIMDRSSSLYCSACRTALGIPLNNSSSVNTDVALTDILARYP